jgi:hypothetical protein
MLFKTLALFALGASALAAPSPGKNSAPAVSGLDGLDGAQIQQLQDRQSAGGYRCTGNWKGCGSDCIPKTGDCCFHKGEYATAE